MFNLKGETRMTKPKLTKAEKELRVIYYQQGKLEAELDALLKGMALFKKKMVSLHGQTWFFIKGQFKPKK